MKIETYYHNFDKEKASAEMLDYIVEALNKSEKECDYTYTAGFRDLVNRELAKDGWAQRVRVSAETAITITGINNNVGLCLQLGNVARIYADLLKLQAIYLKKTINWGILIVPLKEAALQIGSNIVSFERLKKELSTFKEVITIPLVVLGFCK